MDCFEVKNNSSLVRIFHAAPQVQAVDVYINDQIVFNNLVFGDFTKYVYLDEGEYKVDIYLAGNKDNLVLSQLVDIPSREILTVAITGNLDDLGLLVIPDKVSKSPSEKFSSVRIIHLSPDSPGVGLLVNDDKLFDNIGFGEGTDYVDINPGTYNVSIVLSDNKKVLLPFEITLNKDRIYTIYVIGKLPNLQAIQVIDGNTYVCK